MQPKRLTITVVLFLSLSGCAWWSARETRLSDPAALYRKGYDDYQRGRYEKAVESFQRLKEEYPLSDLAIRAELGVADAHFSMEEYGSAESDYETFVNLHPANENLPYAMYQIGMCHYLQILGIDRDQTETMSTVKEFEKLMTRFPTSRFSFLAEKKVKECKNRLAEHEFYIGKLYFRMKQYKAALRRFEHLSHNYANVGLDYKVKFYLEETRKKLAQGEKKIGAK